jgi:CheY-like chemotaxis protein
MVQEIQKAAQHAEHLTRQLLAFSRRQQLKPRVISLNEVVTDTLDLLKRLIGEDVTLTTALAPDLGRVKADPGQIHQVLMNLAVNARDAMPSGGRLTIGTANVALGAQAENEPSLTAGAYVRLTVSDTGDGMDADTQLHVFEPFFTTKEHGKGTGLGLSTVYGIVKQSGGFIRVRSQPGAGSTFTIDLPAIAEAASEPDPVKRTEGLRGTETILVVEDQDDVRNLVAAALRRYGYTVMDASQGEAAVEICRRETRPIHLLIADVVMPGMTGPAVARACRAEQPGLSVLYISGYAEHILRREAGDLPPGSYLQKPFSPAQLAARVRELLDSRSGSAPA